MKADTAAGQGLPAAARSWKRQGENRPWSLQREHGPAELGLWPPELWENMCLLLSAPQFVVIGYSSHRKLTHHLTLSDSDWTRRRGLENRGSCAATSGRRPTQAFGACTTRGLGGLCLESDPRPPVCGGEPVCAFPHSAFFCSAVK